MLKNWISEQGRSEKIDPKQNKSISYSYRKDYKNVQLHSSKVIEQQPRCHYAFINRINIGLPRSFSQLATIAITDRGERENSKMIAEM